MTVLWIELESEWGVLARGRWMYVIYRTIEALFNACKPQLQGVLWSFCIPVVVAGKGLFWWPWADCSSRNLRIVSAWTSSCLSRSLIYHNLIVNCQQTIHGDMDICTTRRLKWGWQSWLFLSGRKWVETVPRLRNAYCTWESRWLMEYLVQIESQKLMWWARGI
jgi:hypothetical protein